MNPRDQAKAAALLRRWLEIREKLTHTVLRPEEVADLFVELTDVASDTDDFLSFPDARTVDE